MSCNRSALINRQLRWSLLATILAALLLAAPAGASPFQRSAPYHATHVRTDLGDGGVIHDCAADARTGSLSGDVAATAQWDTPQCQAGVVARLRVPGNRESATFRARFAIDRAEIHTAAGSEALAWIRPCLRVEQFGMWCSSDEGNSLNAEGLLPLPVDAVEEDVEWSVSLPAWAPNAAEYEVQAFVVVLVSQRQTTIVPSTARVAGTVIDVTVGP